VGKAQNKKGKMGHNTRSHQRGENKAPSGLTYKRKTKKGWETNKVR